MTCGGVTGYYTSRQEDLPAGFDRAAWHWRPVLTRLHGPDLTGRILG